MPNDEITLKYLAEKLEHIHTDVEKNSEDIVKLKTELSYGKGAVKGVLFLGSVVGILIGITRLM
tara:strand:- start:217 stop:408 length:192 start_codon:yes stop_codon:yes gene_type:complete